MNAGNMPSVIYLGLMAQLGSFFICAFLCPISPGIVIEDTSGVQLVVEKLAILGCPATGSVAVRHMTALFS